MKRWQRVQYATSKIKSLPNWPKSVQYQYSDRLIVDGIVTLKELNEYFIIYYVI